MTKRLSIKPSVMTLTMVFVILQMLLIVESVEAADTEVGMHVADTKQR